jgi:hypothetical protein
MRSTICTLFEGNYHYGVAALANSLYKQGYKGSIYAGYRGSFPPWAYTAKEDKTLNWKDGRTFEVEEGLQIHFLPLDTNYHLTNYKPDFMLRLLAGPVSFTQSIFYFDPDIIITAPWTFFETWVDSGVALCEDVNSPLSEFHPRRVAWRDYFSKEGFNLAFKDSTYANGGFIGLSKKDEDFLKVWQRVQESMAPVIGGLNRSSLIGIPLPKEASGPFAPFSKTDQDALNATVEVWEGIISIIGKEGMAFKPGAALMPHALGQPKPWNYKPLIKALTGRSPRLAERQYWLVANSYIVTHSSTLVRFRRFSITLAALLGRFYRKGEI